MASTLLANDILKHRGGMLKNDLSAILKNYGNDDETILSFIDSPYVDLQNIDSYLKQFQGKFCVLSINIQSLNAKFDTFVSFLEDLASSDFYFSAICIQETWITDSMGAHAFDLPNYNAISLPATCSSHSGLMIYLHSSYTFNQLHVSTSPHLWEGLFLEVEGGGLFNKLTLGNIYRPPRDRNVDILFFLQELDQVRSSLPNANNDCFITGVLISIS